MEIPLANTHVVIIFDINSAKHSMDVKNHGHFQRDMISNSFGDLGEILAPYIFPLVACFVEYLNLTSLVSAQSMHFPDNQHFLYPVGKAGNREAQINPFYF